MLAVAELIEDAVLQADGDKFVMILLLRVTNQRVACEFEFKMSSLAEALALRNKLKKDQSLQVRHHPGFHVPSYVRFSGFEFLIQKIDAERDVQAVPEEPKTRMDLLLGEDPFE